MAILEQREIDKLVTFLIKYTAYDEEGIIKLTRLGRDNDGGYIVPEKAVKVADALFGYGISDDNSFEEDFSNKYGKPSYGFDCGVHGFKGKSTLFTFVEECIGTAESLHLKDVSSKKVSSFTEQLDRCQLRDKKVFVKMDIEGGEYKAFEGILPNPKNVTGLVFELHFLYDITEINQAIKLLSDLRKDFILLHVHIVNYDFPHSAYQSKNVVGQFQKVLELTYINRSLVDTFEISKNQKYPTEMDMPNDPERKNPEFEPLMVD
jgi:hypothetical protein